MIEGKLSFVAELVLHYTIGMETFMYVGAVITAAGAASDADGFKPMVNMGSISVAKRVVATLSQAGIDLIIVVTGHNADELEKHLSGKNLVFLRNPVYFSTDMFTSAKIGIQYLMNKCDRILFTPVDVPLFTSDTVKKIISAEGELICPVCNGQEGHPIIFSTKIAENVLHYGGEGGLKGALDNCGAPVTYLNIEDEGILHETDSPNDYSKLLEQHNRQLVRPLISVKIAKEETFLDSKAAELMQLIDESKSVTTACRRMGISYSSGWNIIRLLEKQAGQTIIIRTQGGSGGGSSELSAMGKNILIRFIEYEARLKALANEEFEKFFGDCL